MCLEKCWKNNLNYYKSNPYSFIFPNFRINLSSKVPDKGVPSFLGFTITLGVSVIDRFAEKLPSWGSLVENRPCPSKISPAGLRRTAVTCAVSTGD